MLNVCRMRHGFQQLMEIVRAPYVLDLFAAFERFQHGDRVERVNAFFAQRNDRLVDPLVSVEVKMISQQEVGDFFERVVIKQDRSQNAFLRIQILRRQLIETFGLIFLR